VGQPQRAVRRYHEDPIRLPVLPEDLARPEPKTRRAVAQHRLQDRLAGWQRKGGVRETDPQVLPEQRLVSTEGPEGLRAKLPHRRNQRHVARVRKLERARDYRPYGWCPLAAQPAPLQLRQGRGHG